MAENTGRPYEEIASLTERDNFLTPDEALHLGIIDEVLTSRRDMHRSAARDAA